METALTTDELRRLEQRVTDLETAKTALRDDSDAQEQYSRRNCLLVHGIREGQTDTSDAVLSLCNSQLGLDLNRGHIDRSHRLGYRSETTTAAGSQPKPRPVIVKLTSYETRKVIYTKKRKLKGTRYVVTENLTKRRAEHIAHDNIKNLKYLSGQCPKCRSKEGHAGRIDLRSRDAVFKVLLPLIGYDTDLTCAALMASSRFSCL